MAPWPAGMPISFLSSIMPIGLLPAVPIGIPGLAGTFLSIPACLTAACSCATCARSSAT